MTRSLMVLAVTVGSLVVGDVSSRAQDQQRRDRLGRDAHDEQVHEEQEHHSGHQHEAAQHGPIRYRIAAGDVVVMVEESSGRTWMLQHSANEVDGAVWVPIERIDDGGEGRRWLEEQLAIGREREHAERREAERREHAEREERERYHRERHHAELREHLENLERERDRHVEEHGEDHPVVRDLSREMERVEHELEELGRERQHRHEDAERRERAEREERERHHRERHHAELREHLENLDRERDRHVEEHGEDHPAVRDLTREMERVGRELEGLRGEHQQRREDAQERERREIEVRRRQLRERTERGRRETIERHENFLRKLRGRRPHEAEDRERSEIEEHERRDQEEFERRLRTKNDDRVGQIRGHDFRTSALRMQIEQIARQRDDAKKRYAADHPRVQAYDQQLRQLEGLFEQLKSQTSRKASDHSASAALQVLRRDVERLKQTVQSQQQVIEQLQQHAASVSYTCPMHPQVVQSTGGKCAICGMSLKSAADGPSHTEDVTETDSQASPVEEHILPLLVEEQLLLEQVGPGHPQVVSIRKKIEVTRDLLQNEDEELSLAVEAVDRQTRENVQREGLRKTLVEKRLELKRNLEELKQSHGDDHPGVAQASRALDLVNRALKELEDADE